MDTQLKKYAISVYAGDTLVVYIEGTTRLMCIQRLEHWQEVANIPYKHNPYAHSQFSWDDTNGHGVWRMPEANIPAALAWRNKQPMYKRSISYGPSSVYKTDSEIPEVVLPENCKGYRIAIREINKQGKTKTKTPKVFNTIAEAEAWIQYISGLYSTAWDFKLLHSISPTSNECSVILEMAYKG